MNDLLRRILDREFRDLPGLAISGSIPITESLMNELLAEALTGVTAGDSGAQPLASDRPLNLARIVRLVKKAQVRIGEGAITLEFEVRS